MSLSLSLNVPHISRDILTQPLTHNKLTNRQQVQYNKNLALQKQFCFQYNLSNSLFLHRQLISSSDNFCFPLHRKPVRGERTYLLSHNMVIWYLTSASQSACTRIYRIRKAYLLCRLLCWFWPQTSYNTGRQRSPTEIKIKMGKVRTLEFSCGPVRSMQARSQIPSGFPFTH